LHPNRFIIVKVDRAHSISRKSAQTFFTPKLAKISKKEGQVVHLFFETNLGKNILTRNNKLFSAKKEEKKEKKICKAILPVFTASP